MNTTGLAMLLLPLLLRVGGFGFVGVALASDTVGVHSHNNNTSSSSSSSSSSSTAKSSSNSTSSSSSAAATSSSSMSQESGLVTSSKLQIHVSYTVSKIIVSYLIFISLKRIFGIHAPHNIIIISCNFSFRLPHQTGGVRTSRGPLRHPPLRWLHCPTTLLCRQYRVQFQ